MIIKEIFAVTEVEVYGDDIMELRKVGKNKLNDGEGDTRGTERPIVGTLRERLKERLLIMHTSSRIANLNIKT